MFGLRQRRILFVRSNRSRLADTKLLTEILMSYQYQPSSSASDSTEATQTTTESAQSNASAIEALKAAEQGPEEVGVMGLVEDGIDFVGGLWDDAVDLVGGAWEWWTGEEEETETPIQTPVPEEGWDNPWSGEPEQGRGGRGGRGRRGGDGDESPDTGRGDEDAGDKRLDDNVVQQYVNEVMALDEQRASRSQPHNPGGVCDDYIAKYRAAMPLTDDTGQRTTLGALITMCNGIKYGTVYSNSRDGFEQNDCTGMMQFAFDEAGFSSVFGFAMGGGGVNTGQMKPLIESTYGGFSGAPSVGDVMFWRDSGGGHAVIVTSINGDEVAAFGMGNSGARMYIYNASTGVLIRSTDSGDDAQGASAEGGVDLFALGADQAGISVQDRPVDSGGGGDFSATSTDTFLGYWNPNRIPGYSASGEATVSKKSARGCEPGGSNWYYFDEGDQFTAFEQRDGSTLLGDGVGYAWIDSANAQIGS